jgi:hypothetical protein
MILLLVTVLMLLDASDYTLESEIREEIAIKFTWINLSTRLIELR